MVEITKLYATPNSLEFTTRGVDLGLLNAVRCALITDVCSLVIDFVDIKVNSSLVGEQAIATGLGQVPLASDDAVSHLVQRHECNCNNKGCFACSVFFSLDVVNIEMEVLTVTSERLVPTDAQREYDVSVGIDPDAHIVSFPSPFDEDVDGGKRYHVPLVELGKGHRVQLTAVARLGNGKEHIKWSPTSTASIQHKRVVYIDTPVLRTLPQSARVAIVKSCPRGVLALDDVGDIEDIAPEKCTNCRECVNSATAHGAPAGAVDVELYSDELTFSATFIGPLSPIVAFNQAIEHISTTLDAILEVIDDDDDDDER